MSLGRFPSQRVSLQTPSPVQLLKDGGKLTTCIIIPNPNPNPKLI